jgi:hypothetical protein
MARSKAPASTFPRYLDAQTRGLQIQHAPQRPRAKGCLSHRISWLSGLSLMISWLSGLSLMISGLVPLRHA